MSWLSKTWGMFGDSAAQKSWSAGDDDGPADEVEYAHFLERFGDAAYRPDGRLKRPEDFTDFGHRQLAEQVWRSGEQPRGEFLHPVNRPGEDPEPRSLRPFRVVGEDEGPVAVLLSAEGEGEGAPAGERANASAAGEPRAVMAAVAPLILDPDAAAKAAEMAERQRRNDQVRVQHAVDSLATLGYWDTYYAAKEFRIKFVDWLPGGAAGFTNPLTGTIYVSRDSHATQLRLLETIVHECQHVTDWFAFGRLPKHDEQKRATPSEDEIQGDYLRAVLNGLIREDGIAPKPSLEVQRKGEKGQAPLAGDEPAGSEEGESGSGRVLRPATIV